MNQDNIIIDIGRKLRLNKINYLIKFIKELIYYRGLLWGKLTSINDILAGNFPNINVLSYDNTRLSYSPPIFNDGLNNKTELMEGKDYPQYIVQIKDAIVYGDSNTINLTSNSVLYDMPVFDKSRRFKYSTNYSKIITIKGDTVFYWKGKTLALEKAIWMGGNFSWNYYHLVYEFIVKFIYLNELDIPLDVPVLIDQTCLDVPQYKELLDIANKKGYQLIGVSRRARFNVGELIYINCPNFIPPNNADENSYSDDIQFDINSLHKLRNYLLPHSSQRKFPKRIFISRKNASARRKFNEDAVIQLLSEFGFETVFPEKLSFADQISLFNQAEWIIGGSGAAFTNLLFCSKLCKVIIVFRGYFPFSGFSTIASAFDIHLLYLTEEDTNKNMIRGNIHDAFEIDLLYLKKQLNTLGL
jgi:capsular polysaccharide biosynthesis protein